MPPESPPTDEPYDRRSVFYRYLRPELVRNNPAPLSSDAFTQWGEYGNILDVIKDKREVR
jgi:hypothetical protein